MVRQCAWCLRLVNSQGEPISKFAIPKLYEATHVMCRRCGFLWLEAVEGQNEGRASPVVGAMQAIEATPPPEENDNTMLSRYLEASVEQ
jgi:hypothetical protein